MANDSTVFRALADDTRRGLFEALSQGPASVADLTRAMTVTQSAVSQHLAVLKAAGLVSDKPDGRRRIYAANRAGLAPLRAWLDGFWDAQLAAYKSAAEGEDR